MSVRTHGRMEHKQVDFYLSDEQNMIRKICSWIVDVVVALAFAWFCLVFFGTQVTVIEPTYLKKILSDEAKKIYEKNKA